MPTKLSDIEKHEDGACLLVGRFFYYWGYLEQTINRAIRELFGLTAVQGAILLTNIQVRDKLHILSTVIDLEAAAHNSQKEWLKAAAKTIEKIENMATQRNMLAHTAFSPTEKGQVDFFRIEAKGKLGLPRTVWTEKDFNSRYTRLQDLQKEVLQILADLKQRQMRERLAKALAQPTSDIGLLGGLFGLGSQIQDHPGSLSSTHGTSPPTHQKPPEREG